MKIGGQYRLNYMNHGLCLAQHIAVVVLDRDCERNVAYVVRSGGEIKVSGVLLTAITLHEDIVDIGVHSPYHSSVEELKLVPDYRIDAFRKHDLHGTVRICIIVILGFFAARCGQCKEKYPPPPLSTTI